MTLILELPAEVEARLRAEAQARGVTPEELALESVNAKYERDDPREKKLAAIRAARGALKRATGEHGYGLGAFLEEKHTDVARENAS